MARPGVTIPPVKVRVLAFAGVREILGAGELVIDLPEGAGLGELRSHLDREHPELASYWQRLALAVDGRLGEGEAPLRDGSEVALLPPVSGGSGRTEILVDGRIEIEGVIARVAARGRGAVLTFQGTVRDRHGGRQVTHLVYDAYRSMAEEAVRHIVREVEVAAEDLAVEIVHRLGKVKAGETSVVIAVASPHREVAYQASRTALERLKHEVPIWKREHYADGEAMWREDEPLGALSPGSTATP